MKIRLLIDAILDEQELPELMELIHEQPVVSLGFPDSHNPPPVRAGRFVGALPAMTEE